MPVFIPDHSPKGLDDFTRGYLDCAEWLLDEEIDRNKVKGWAPASIIAAVVVCREFQEANAADLAQYEEATGRDMKSAGHDFWLTRNRHGAGFWDRGDDPCLARLTIASHAYGEIDAYVERGLIYLA